MEFHDPEVIKSILTHYRSWAIVGASASQSRPSHGVMRFLDSLGYQVIPINPNENEVLGKKCFPSLTAASSEYDIEVVDVFRKPSEVEAIALEAIAIGARAIWFQLGVVNTSAANTAKNGGLQVVMDTCPLIEIPKLGLSFDSWDKSSVQDKLRSTEEF